MQFALGSVLKLTRSAFGGLGSFRAPSIRRALPVLLGGLLCAVGSTAMAQQISGISLTSTPTGGSKDSPNTVYIIGNTITIAIDYNAAIAGDPGSPTLRFLIGSQNRTATCATRTASRLLCSYVVREGDTGNSIQVEAGDQLVGGSVPDRSPDDELTTLANNSDGVVDGVRLKLNSIASTGMGTDPGFKAGRMIELMLTFGDGATTPTTESEMSNTGAMGATLVLENAERSARYVNTNGGIVTFNYTVVAGDNGAFGLKLTGIDALSDKNGNKGLATGWESTVAQKLAAMPAAQRRVDTRGPRVTQIKQGYVKDDTPARDTELDTTSGPVMDGTVVFDVFFDEPVVETTDATLRVTVGRSTTATSKCIALAKSEWMRCNLEVDDGWLDTDGLSTPANPLNYTSLEDELGNPATPAFAAQQFPKVKVDTVAPTVSSATISVPKAEIGGNVIVKVTFSEDVKASLNPTASATIGIEGSTTGGTVAAFWSVSGKVVEFRYALQDTDFAERTTENTSSTVTVTSLNATGIGDLAGNPVEDDPAVTHTRASDPGTTFNRKTIGDSDRQTVYADVSAPRLERISLIGNNTNGVKEVYGIGDEITFEILFSET